MRSRESVIANAISEMKDETPYVFTAKTARSDDENEVFTVGVASESGPYFMVQRSLDKEDEDSQELYIEFEDQSNGGYDTLDSLVLSRNRLVASLKDGKRIEAVLEISDEMWTALREDLLRCFAGFENLLQLES